MFSSYYNQNAQAFFTGTANVEMTTLYDKFVPSIAKGARILDAGCGSGRDSKYFASQGFKVQAFDASEQLVELARKHTGLNVIKATFLEFEPTEQVDAIWACASLLHVAKTELSKTIIHLSTMLKNKGIFYCSFKYGDEEVERDGRRFTNVNELSLPGYLDDSILTIKEQWITNDLRPDREHEKWLNCILVKSAVKD